MDLSNKMPVKRARIEIVPLIDCMFLLLVFFVYSMMTLTQPKGIPLNLPKAETTTPMQEESVNISITSNDEIYLNNEKIGMDALRTRIEVICAANPSVRVLINGDAGARHGTVVKVLDLLRILAVQHVAIQTIPLEPEEP
jgi:biopolymer transport protein ExbD